MPQISTFLLQHLPEQLVLWLLILPILITVIVIGRQMIGVKGLGLSSPIIIGLSFTATGLQAGLIILSLVLLISFIIRTLLTKIRLLYLPKMSLAVIGSTIAVAGLIPLIPYKDLLDFPQTTFALILIILVTEQFVASIIERGPRKTFGIALETISVSTLVFFIATWSDLAAFAVSYPLLVIAGCVVINILLGKWTGLRVSEYIRFKDIIFKK
jgi:hypothetical protein